MPELRETRSGLQISLAVSPRETASEVEAVFESSYIAEVDRAIEELAVATPTGVRSFGEMVARRGMKRALNAAL